MKQKKLKIKTGLIVLGCSLIITASACKNTANETDTVSRDTEISVGTVTFIMKKIPAADMQTVGDDEQSSNMPHKVSISEYYIGETEITQALWQEIMGDNPSKFQGTKNPPVKEERQENRPVENINWYQAVAFCNKLSLRCKRELCYKVEGVDFAALSDKDIPFLDDEKWNKAELDLSKNGFRLPTEAEWEWAAQGGQKFKYAGSDNAEETVWAEFPTKGIHEDRTHEVAKKKKNGYGLYDMCGNVAEWCTDTFEVFTKDREYPQDYVCTTPGEYRVIRGGMWNEEGDECECSLKNPFSPSDSGSHIGLRIVFRR